MPSDADASPPRVRSTRYWPLWSSAALLAAGAFIALAETTSFLVVAGLGLAGVGAYGVVFRRKLRTARAPGSGEPARPNPLRP